MSISCFLSLQKLDLSRSVSTEPEGLDDQNREVLDLIRDKAATAREFYRRTHAIVQEAQRLIEQASANAKNAEARAAAAETALKAAEERACRSEAKNLELIAQLGVVERHPLAHSTNEIGQAPTNMRRIRPTLPIRSAAKSHEDATLRKVWPFR